MTAEDEEWQPRPKIAESDSQPFSYCLCWWFCPPGFLGEPIWPDKARDAVTGWLKANPRTLGTAVARQLKRIETFTDANEQAVYYVAYLLRDGYAIAPADDLVLGRIITSLLSRCPNS
ncbi:MAG: hypothetical protein JXN61_15205 [Sedimentisphaerales bacterium]|nr:hypothetical protein [Sedimentisphaerales bacterium]